MAYRNKVLINSLTGQDIRFLKTAKDTAGKFLEMETTYNSYSTEPPLHYTRASRKSSMFLQEN